MSDFLLSFLFAEEISRISDPLNWTEKKMQIFRNACQEMAVFHHQSSPDIRHLYKKRGFDPLSANNGEVWTEVDLEKIPPIGVTAMKQFLMTSLSHDQVVLKLTSSGTRGQKTQIWFDQASLDRVQKMMDGYFLHEGWVSNQPTNYLVFNYDPEDAGDLGIAFSEKNLLRFAPIADVFFTIRKNRNNEWSFEKEKALEYLIRYSSEDKPVRIFAMPGFLYEFYQYLRENLKKPLQLPEGSRIFTGGGWKAAQSQEISREAFCKLGMEILGIPEENQRDGYGMAEHCAPYFECKMHRFHIPVYCRILIRDPVSGEVLTPGNDGLMELITPFNAMMPTLAILTTDYGRVHSGVCPCGFSSPTFEVLGRAGIAKHKGCAVTASEIVRR